MNKDVNYLVNDFV